MLFSCLSPQEAHYNYPQRSYEHYLKRPDKGIVTTKLPVSLSELTTALLFTPSILVPPPLGIQYLLPQ